MKDILKKLHSGQTELGSTFSASTGHMAFTIPFGKTGQNSLNIEIRELDGHEVQVEFYVDGACIDSRTINQTDVARSVRQYLLNLCEWNRIEYEDATRTELRCVVYIINSNFDEHIELGL